MDAMGSEGPAVVTDLKLSKQGDTEIIVPAEPTPDGRLFLSNIDQCLVIPVETIYFYPPNPNKPVDNLVEVLKDALAKVLVPYHFMTGRLKPEGPGSRRLEIDLNRAGAEFSHYTSDVRIADLGDVVQPNPLFRKLVPTKFLNVTSALDTPLLAIQVRFSPTTLLFCLARIALSPPLPQPQPGWTNPLFCFDWMRPSSVGLTLLVSLLGLNTAGRIPCFDPMRSSLVGLTLCWAL